MTVLANSWTAQLQADRDQLFRDWAKPLSCRAIRQVANPDLSTLVETVTEIEIPALISEARAQPTRDTHQMHVGETLTALLRADDLTDTFQAAGDSFRVIHDGCEWDVREIEMQPLTHTVLWVCQRRG